MSTRWFLVKMNWPETTARQSDYAGVGGDVWPLDGFSDEVARTMNHGLMAARVNVEIGDSAELLCLNRAVAEAYWQEVNRRTEKAWLIEIALASDVCEPSAGFDLGFPSGGGSLVESELITVGRSGPPLNKWGLLDSEQDAISYVAGRAYDSTLEDMERVRILAVKVLRCGQYSG